MSYENLSDDDLRAVYDGRVEDLSDDALRQVYKETEPTFTERVAEHKDSLQATGKPSPREWFNDAEIKEGVDVGKRVLQGVADPIHGGAQLLSHLVPQGIADVAQAADQWLYDKTSGLFGHNQGIDADLAAREKEYQATQAPEGFDWSRALGNVAGSLALPAGSGKSLLGLVTGGALGGLATPVTDTTDESYAAQKAKQAALGAGAGAILKAVLPHVPLREGVEELRASGVNPTIGQAFNGFLNKVEQKATSIPFVGDAILAARQRARDQFNTATILNKVLSDIPQTTEVGNVAKQVVGHEQVRAAENAISSAYTKAKENVTQFWADDNVIRKRMKDDIAALLPKARKKFEAALASVNRASDEGFIDFKTGDDFKRYDAELGKLAHDFTRSNSPETKQAGAALYKYRDYVRAHGEAFTGDVENEGLKALQHVDKSYAKMKTVEDAASRSATGQGVFTPGQLLMAIKANNKGKFAEGVAAMQDWAETGQRILGDTYPDSGTAGRLINTLGLASGIVHPGYPAAMLGGALVYSPLVQKAIIEYMQAGYPLVDAIKLATAKAAPQTLTRKEARAK